MHDISGLVESIAGREPDQEELERVVEGLGEIDGGDAQVEFLERLLAVSELRAAHLLLLARSVPAQRSPKLQLELGRALRDAEYRESEVENDNEKGWKKIAHIVMAGGGAGWLALVYSAIIVLVALFLR